MTTETQNLVTTPEILTLKSGFQVSVSRVKTIQLLRFLNIFANSENVDTLMYAVSEAEDENERLMSLVAAVISAFPNAEDEVLKFIISLVEPAHLRPSRSKADKEFNDQQYDALADEMGNPEIEDVIVILEHVIRKELPEFTALGKRLAALLTVAQPKAATK